jgi:hypothetical protein
LALAPDETRSGLLGVGPVVAFDRRDLLDRIGSSFSAGNLLIATGFTCLTAQGELGNC